MDFIPAKTIVNKAKAPEYWFGADYNMNIYRGCTHGCIYCDSRSTCYQNPDFGSVKVKEDALLTIRNDLKRKIKTGVVGTGAMSDPYNPFEEELCLTSEALKLLHTYGFGTAISTKSPLVTRDIPILQQIKVFAPVLVNLTITTADDTLCKYIEPNAAPSSKRFEALSQLREAGIFCGILMMPLLPWICDTEENVRSIIRQAKEAGASYIYPSFGMTLRDGNREYYYEKLDAHFPGLRRRYTAAYGTQYTCNSRKAKQLSDIFSKECEANDILYSMKDIIRASRKDTQTTQLTLF